MRDARMRDKSLLLVALLGLTTLSTLHERNGTLFDRLDTVLVAKVLLERQPLLEDGLALLCTRWRAQLSVKQS